MTRYSSEEKAVGCIFGSTFFFIIAINLAILAAIIVGIILAWRNWG